MLDPRRLRVLVEVQRRGSIAGAAESLSFVPSGISQQIGALERELGIELTARSGRRTVLTSAGRLLVEHAEGIFAGMAGAEAALRELNGLASSRLRVACFSSAAATLLPRVFATLVDQHPGIRVSLVDEGPPESILALKDHDVDLAVIDRYPTAEEAPEIGVAECELMAEGLLLAVSPSHWAALESNVALERLTGETWIASGPATGLHRFVTRACRKVGFEPRIGFTTDDHLVALRLVACGLGVSVIPALSLTGLHEHVELVSLDGAPARSVLAAWRENDSSEAIAVAVALLVAEAQRLV